MSQESSRILKKTGKFVLITVGLGLVGILFAVLGALIGGRLLAGDSTGFASLGLAIGGIIVGYPAGIILGVVLLKKVLHQRGSLWLGIAGSVLGAVLTLFLAEPLNLNADTNILFGTFLVVVPACCLAGFYLRRR